MNPQIEIRDLLLVRAISRVGGVSKAARSLGLSQSAVSHHLSRLEQRLEVKLFHRRGRALEISVSGLQLLELGDEVVPKLVAVERKLRAPVALKLRMATQCYTGYRWLPQLTEVLAKSHPTVRLQIELAATRDPLAALDAGTLDLALVHSAPPPAPYQARIVGEDELLLVMAPSHPLASLKRVRPTELEPHKFYVFDSSRQMLRAQAVQTFPDGDAPTNIERVPITEAMIALLLSGQGVSMVSRWIVAPYIKSGELVSRRLVGANCRRTWRAIYQKDGPLLAAIKVVVASLRETNAIG